MLLTISLLKHNLLYMRQAALVNEGQLEVSHACLYQPSPLILLCEERCFCANDMLSR